MRSLKFPQILPQIFAPIFLEKIVMQKMLQNFAQKQSENLLNAKKTQNYAEKFMQKKKRKKSQFPYSYIPNKRTKYANQKFTLFCREAIFLRTFCRPKNMVASQK